MCVYLGRDVFLALLGLIFGALMKSTHIREKLFSKLTEPGIALFE